LAIFLKSFFSLKKIRKSYEENLKDITAIINKIGDYKTHPQISTKDIKALNDAETYLM